MSDRTQPRISNYPRLFAFENNLTAVTAAMTDAHRRMMFQAALLLMASDPIVAKVPTALDSILNFILSCCHVPCIKPTAKLEYSPIRMTVSANRTPNPSQEQRQEGDSNDVVEVTAIVDPHADTSGPARAHNIIHVRDLGHLASCVGWFEDVVVVDGLSVRGEIVLKCRLGSTSPAGAGKCPVRTMWEWKFSVVEAEEGAGNGNPGEVPIKLSSDALQQIYNDGGWQQQARPVTESKKDKGCVPICGEPSEDTWEERKRRAKQEEEEIARRKKEKLKGKASQSGQQEGSSGSKKNSTGNKKNEDDKNSNEKKSTDQEKKTDPSGKEGDSDKENNGEEASQGRE